MNPTTRPVARELFAQWHRARGGRREAAGRPFTRGFEDLLGDAALLSATERADAEADLRQLAADGWLEVRPVRLRPHLLDRVLLPTAAEPRWRDAFGVAAPTDEELRRWREFPWVPDLAFAADGGLNLPFEDLVRLHEFLHPGAPNRPVVPIKERSLQIFGREKRLDELADSLLFRPGRLELRTHLRCEPVGVPLAWRRGPAAAADQPILVVENAATWHSYTRWNALRSGFSAVAYGDGNRFVDSVTDLAEIFREVGDVRPVFYFGDLDAAGLRIPQAAAQRALAAGLPAVLPHLWSYHQLLTFAPGRGQPGEPAPAPETADSLCAWLGDLAAPARALLARGERLAQEHLGWEFLAGADLR